MAVDTAIFDVDGTLVDSNYQHVLAWHRSFRRFDLTVPLWRIHGAIGMGGDQLVSAIVGEDVEAAHGDDLRQAWTQEFSHMINEIAPLAGAVELLTAVKSAGVNLVLASSGAPEQVEHYLGLLDGKSLADAWTTSEDVEATKPAPDLVKVAMDKVGATNAVMIGDSPWDVVAAAELSIPTYCVRTGGFGEQELTDVGARAVYDDLAALQNNLDRILGSAPS